MSESPAHLWCRDCGKHFTVDGMPDDLTRCPWCLGNRFNHTEITGKRASGTDWRRRRRAVIKRDGAKCAHCGATEDLTMDHVVPLAKGGTNRIENLQVLCHRCNQIKGDKLPGAEVA